MADNSIVPSGGLDRFEQFDPNGFFNGIVDAESAKQAVGKIKVLEDMLKAADQFGEYASKFCLLEAQMYVEIAEIEGAESKLGKAQRRIVDWIRSKTAEQLNEVIVECSDGIRIQLVMKHEIGDEDKAKRIENECKRISDVIVDEAIKNGKTRLNRGRFYEESRRVKLDSDMVDAYVESTRDRLLKSHVLGLGDGNGTYLTPPTCSREEIASIIGTRIRSISNDLVAIRQICVNAHFDIPREALKPIQHELTILNMEHAK